MIKKIILLILIFPIFCFGYEINIGYNQSKNTFMKSLDFKNEIKDKSLTVTYGLKIKELTEGYGHSINFHSEYDIDKQYDIFADSNYETNSILFIHDRIDFCVGFGYVFQNNKNTKQKISYGLLYRDNKVLNSFRYKINYENLLLKSKLVANYIFPERELKTEAELGIKIFKFAVFSLKNEFVKTKTSDDYITYSNIKLNL